MTDHEVIQEAVDAYRAGQDWKTEIIAAAHPELAEEIWRQIVEEQYGWLL